MQMIVVFVFRADTTQNYRKLQLCFDNERNATFSSFASGKLRNIRLNQSDETCVADQQNHIVKISQFSQNVDDEEGKKPVILTVEKISADATPTSLAGNKILTNARDLSLIRDSSILYDSYAHPFQECRVMQENKAKTTMSKRHASEMDDLTCSFLRFIDNNRPPEIDWIGEGSEDKDSEAMRLVSTGKKQENSDTSVENCIPGLHDDVAGVIGQRLFWKARQTIVHQQKIFAVQIFELHRLVKESMPVFN
ncbi:uncharacterized protein [Primulina eburnea]|uniref:uncharacterized protein n=1 Tax=Primulina eburnea TaxID=1245227 RepID=UPI003C6C0427